MKISYKVLLLFCLIVVSGVFATPENLTKIQAYKIIDGISIDGKLTEKVYQNPAVEEFTQRDPKEGEKPTERTKFWIGYDDSYVYFAAKLYDSNPDSILGRLTRRDNITDSDWFGIAIDSYHDRKTGFYFKVNPAGSIEDGVYYNDSWNDNSWDGVWSYAASIDNEGWNVEIAIPYSQLRFNKAEEMIWGINAARSIIRRNEEDYLVMVPKKESGFVSHFAQLVGLKAIEPKQRLEVLPYIVQKSQYLVHDSNDPFYKSSQYRTTFGADIKFGLGSNLTIDATINPDFGQVEVDPAVVNLSAFETYFQEKRPFFIEGSNIFSYGYGGSNSNWGFNWGNPEFFYSRRVGRSPQRSIDDYDFIKSPGETRILGAAKVSGKIGEDWSIGAINAVTERMYANIEYEGKRNSLEVEPLTNYGVIRSQKEFNKGKQGLGLMFTSVNRDLRSDGLSSILSKQSYVFGLDGWAFLDSSETYVVTSYLAGSYVQGSKDYLVQLQEAPIRYMQRPDASYARLDSNRTSLSGFVTRIALNKQKGNFYINSALGIVSPGFECNDAGFQWKANAINAHLVLGYHWFDPDKIFKKKNFYVSYARNYDFDGNIDNDVIGVLSNAQFLNYYGFYFNTFIYQKAYTSRLTRGGPLAKNPNGYEIDLGAYSDNRKSVVVTYDGYVNFDASGGKSLSSSLSLEVKPTTSLSISVGPQYSYNIVKSQWVTNQEDAFATTTYGSRYIFAELDQKTISGDIRVNWIFTPKLSLQLYIQPLFSVGEYKNYKELAKPKSMDYNSYGKNGSTIEYDKDNTEFDVDPDGNGPVAKFSFSNPDFNYKSVRANLVLRWEFLPGSAFYFVWQHNKENYDDPGEFSFRRDFRKIIDAVPNNIYLIKFSYWLDI